MSFLHVLLFGLLIAVSIVTMVWHFRRSREILADWASQNAYQLVGAERRWMFKGPFLFWSSDGQVVYHVTVRDREGHLRRGYVRCGGWFLGLLSNVTSVRWDD